MSSGRSWNWITRADCRRPAWVRSISLVGLYEFRATSFEFTTRFPSGLRSGVPAPLDEEVASAAVVAMVKQFVDEIFVSSEGLLVYRRVVRP